MRRDFWATMHSEQLQQPLCCAILSLKSSAVPWGCVPSCSDLDAVPDTSAWRVRNHPPRVRNLTASHDFLRQAHSPCFVQAQERDNEKKRSAFHTRGRGTAGPRAIKPRGTMPRWRDGSPGCGTPGSAGAAGGVTAALVQPVFHRSRAFPAHLVLLVPSAFSAGRLQSYETLGSGFCAPEKSDRPFAGCCQPPPASPWDFGEAGTCTGRAQGLDVGHPAAGDEHLRTVHVVLC